MLKNPIKIRKYLKEIVKGQLSNKQYWQNLKIFENDTQTQRLIKYAFSP